MLRAPSVVGRERERGILLRAAAPREAGQAGAVAVVGPPGAGKSALVRAVAEAGAQVLVGRAAPSTQGDLSPVVELAVGLLDRGARHDEVALGVLLPAVRALLPGLAGGGDGLRADVPHPVLLADGLLRLWATLAVPRRPVLVLEDLHWAGEATWAVTDRILRRAAAVGVGVVVTSRPEGPWWSELAHAIRSGEVTGVDVDPLLPTDVADLVAGCLGVPGGDVPSQVLAVVEAAGGLPLMVEEILVDLTRMGALVSRDGRWSWQAETPVLPRPLADATRERLGRLPDGVAGVVRWAAVLGTAPSLELLRATAPGGVGEVSAAVVAAVEVGLLQVDHVTGRVEFRHELVREAVVAAVLEPDRRADAGALLAALVGVPVDGPPGPVVAAAVQLDDAGVALAGRLATDSGLIEVAGRLHLALAKRQLRRGLPLLAAAAAGTAARLASRDTTARAEAGVRAEALAVEVQALALAGEVDRALAAADLLEAVSAAARAHVREAVARALAVRGDWDQAEGELAALRGPSEPPGVTALAALIALERGRLQDAEDWAGQVLRAAVDGPAQCQALEVLGRLARGRDLDEAQARFRRCALVAQASDLIVWRARALHEEATIEQLRSMDVEPLHLARRSAIEAGAPGLVSSVDFHLAAVLGMRFESDLSLQFARGLLADARAQGARRMQAWAWVLIGQAHAVGGHRAQAEAAAQEAIALAPGDREVEAVAIGTGRALPALLAEDPDVGLAQWRSAVEALRELPSVTPLPPWYLWPVLATVTDLDGDDGARARAEAGGPQLRLLPGVDGVRLLAEAVAAGRRADLAGATAAAQAAQTRFDRVPAFAGWRHLARRWVAADAIAAGWGDPAAWMTDAADWFAGNGFDAPATACWRLARQAGAPQRRRGRGQSQVPQHLHRLGVTSREMDVLTLVADGLTNTEIAARLHLSPRTVKGYVEQLLAKTGTGNRTQLATRRNGQLGRSEG